MRYRQYVFALPILAVLAAFGLASNILATETADLSHILIANFGRVDDGYYRGAQPQKQDYARLAAAGIKTVVDVHKNGPKNEQALTESAGMKFYRIPLSESDVPTPEQVKEFLAIVNDPANQPVYVHCAGGRHRTGALTAVYRLTHDHWTANQAYDEMKQYEFLKNGDHNFLKNFVYQYSSQLNTKAAAAEK